MSRRRKNNKRVLRSPRDNRPPRHMQKRMPPKTRSSGKASKTTMVLMIVALVAFVIGAGIGISMALGDSSSDDKKIEFENVTVEMTSNLNNTTVDYYDGELDGIDFNNKNDIKQYNLTSNNVTY